MKLQTEHNLPSGLDDFLQQSGWGESTVQPLPGDASFRRYFRVSGSANGNAMLMDAPPPHENPRPFIDVAEYLTGHGFRAPKIFSKNLDRGLVLIEDFGDRRMREHLDAQPDDEARIYTQAIDTLIDLTRTECADLPPYDEAAYLREVRLLTEWYLPAMQLDFDQSEFDRMWNDALAPIAGTQVVTVLRDYHAENIMLLDDGAQGLIDFQDALIGHPAYDLVSLLQDARRNVSTELETQMLDYYIARAQPDYDFGHHYALIGAQRNTKIIGIFTRLWKRDGKLRYLDFLPRMWALLERDLNHPQLAALKNWFDTYIPQDIRKIAPNTLAPE
jgi:N-acetylmuramate 1-kinase